MKSSNKKIWIDIEEPKTGIMFNSLINKFQNENMELLITARDYDSTFQILDDLSIDYVKVGNHGGEKLENKLSAYIRRLNELFPLVIDFNPDYFVTFSSVEGPRISFGLNIPSIGYNDEPRNTAVCKLIFPFLDKIITPDCVPENWYIQLYADPEKLIRYHGIDEIAWLSHYKPNPVVLDKYDLDKGKYIIMRSEPSFASYFIDKLEPHQTLLSKIFPPIFKKYPNYKYFLIVRTIEQETYLREKLKDFRDDKNLVITRYLPNILDLCYYGALTISGGGTIVRESSLLNVPSIEYFPGETAPQEHFLMKNGFPLIHIKNFSDIITKAMEILTESPRKSPSIDQIKKRILQFENPNEICFKIVKEGLDR
jgi:predicted glycosyltransferase